MKSQTELYFLIIGGNIGEVSLWLTAMQEHNLLKKVIHVKDAPEAIECLKVIDARCAEVKAEPPKVVVIDLPPTAQDNEIFFEFLRSNERMCSLVLGVVTTSSDSALQEKFERLPITLITRPVGRVSLNDSIQMILSWLTPESTSNNKA